MRTDVKIGLFCSLVVVVLAGWYFVGSGGKESDIPISGGDTLTALTEFDPQSEQVDSGAEAAETAASVLAPVQDQQVDTPGAFDVGETVAGSESGSSLADLFAARSDDDAPAEHDAGGQGERPSRHDLTQSEGARRPKPSLETHTVKLGDTLAGLARMYYGDERLVGVLREANPQIVNPRLLAVGATVRIPDRDDALSTQLFGRSSTERGTAGSGGRTYVVKPGDTLYRIALDQLASGSRWNEIHALNKDVIGDDPGLLKVGAVLKLPRK